MMQISNLDESKTDWINETQLIIPMVDGEEIQAKDMDDISKGGITLNALEGGEQPLLSNPAGHAFVIGLDRNVFDNYSSKSDLLLMQNADLKLLPAAAASDGKLTYSLSSVEQSKNEIVWEQSGFEKPLTKDILNAIQESSKNWGDLGKNVDVCLEDIGSQPGNKLSTDFLLDGDLGNKPKKGIQDSDDQQYIVGYYPVVGTCDAVLVPASLMTAQTKIIENLRTQKAAVVIENDMIINSKDLNHILASETIEDTQSLKWLKPGMNLVPDHLDKINGDIMKIDNTQEKSLLLPEGSVNKLNESVMPLMDHSVSQYMETKCGNGIIYNELEKCLMSDGKCNEKSMGHKRNVLPEKNLPLKKKAKMKKSPGGGNSIACGKNDMDVCSSEFHLFGNCKGSYEKGNEPLVSHYEESPKEGYESDGSSSGHGRGRLETSASYNFKKKRKRSGGSVTSEVGTADGTRDAFSGGGTPPVVDEDGGEYDDEPPYRTMTELLERLRSDKYISDSISKILLAGLQEMDVDILKEMYSKRSSGHSGEYSCQLKAFALMLYFKQRNAFNHLGKLFENGWPSIDIIKDWKRRLNNHRRPNANAPTADGSQRIS